MSKLKAGMKLADFLAQATGRQINTLMSKLGMDKDILKGMSDNQVKGAILDESQQYMRNKRRNTNRRVGTAAAAGAATYGVIDFVHDMLGISSVSKDADRVPSGSAVADTKTTRSSGEGSSVKPKKKVTTPTPPPEGRKTKRNATTTRPTPKPKRNNTKKDKSDVTFQFETINKNKGGSVTKSNKGPQDYRKGGMVLSSVDNRKNRK